MNIAGKFEKVSPSRFRSDWADTFAGESAEKIQKIYEVRIQRPRDRNSNGFSMYRTAVYNKLFSIKEFTIEYVI